MTFRKLLTASVLLGMVGVLSLLAQGQGQPPSQNKGTVSMPPKGTNKEDANLRSIEGVVQDADKNLVPKAIVQLKDMRTLSIRSFVSTAEGEYHFAGLRLDNDYELKATLGEKNSATKRVSSFESRKTVTVNLQLEK
ncbi:MAG: carboxypeptidase-like regulatory domain-containing protein [Bryobacteraceae bacterium]